jgi:hypothetical protein
MRNQQDPYIVRRQPVFDAAVRTAFAQIIGGPETMFGPGYQPSANDAANGIGFLISQLAYTEAQVFSVMREPLQFRQMIPVSTAAGEGAEVIRYETTDNVGRGKRISASGKDIPMANVLDGDATMPIVLGGIGYEYNTEELRKAAFLRRPLPTRRLNAAMDAYERHLNDVALNGEDNLPGFINSPQIASGNAPNGAWTAADAAKILADLNFGIMKIWDATAKTDVVTDIALPNDEYALIATTPMNGYQDKTILEWLLERNIARIERNQTINITAVSSLKTAGSGGTSRAVFYVKRDDRLVMHLPMPLRFLAPQPVALSMQVPGEYKYSGVEWYYPQSAYYMDGI